MFGNALPPQHDPGRQAPNLGYHHPVNPPGEYSYAQPRTTPARSVVPVRDHTNSFLPPVQDLQGAQGAPPVQSQPGTSTASSIYALTGPEPLPVVYSQPEPRYYNTTDGIPSVPFYGAPQETSTSVPFLQSEHIELKIRQQPMEALIAYEGKEKTRKPVDPPPILQIIVDKEVDREKQYLQSPYMFMCASLYKPDLDEPWDASGNKSLAGSVTSSLHRLKDTNNEDGGFFVFGDISVKVSGTFRLHFSLFDLRKDLKCANYLGSVTSDRFRVCLPKDYRGLEESTYLSRAFSDQGVRLRLRKEPRGPRRAYPYSDGPVPNTNARMNPGIYHAPRHSPYPTQPTQRRALMHTQGRSSSLRRFPSNISTEENEHYADPSTNPPTSAYSMAHYSGLPSQGVPPLFNQSIPPGFTLLQDETTQRGQFHPDPRNMP